jgi:sigma-B regulation protein RsbU (phosphoserine phosphatase)
MFVTVFYGILNTATGEIEYVNAGHNPPYVVSDGKLTKVAMTGGTILGWMDDFEYRSANLRLNPGDLLFLYTDGVTEAFDTNDEQYGEERLENYLLLNHSGGISEIVTGSVAEVTRYSTGMPQSDDITLLAVRYNGK